MGYFIAAPSLNRYLITTAKIGDNISPECNSGLISHALRNHCADVNLVISVFTERKRWIVIPTSTALSTGTDMDDKVLGTIDTCSTYLHLLPGTLHQVRLRLEETLMVLIPTCFTYWWATTKHPG